jgi:ERCC4-type nuclease
MNLVFDERENSLYQKCVELNVSMNLSIALEKRVIPIGDILLRNDDGKDILIIERKTFSDLISSIKDGRYEEQSYRLTHSSGIHTHSIIYLIEGVFSQLSSSDKKMVNSTMTSISIFKGFSIFRSASMQETAEWILQCADKIDRSIKKGRIPKYIGSQEQNVVGQELTASSYCNVVKKVKKDNITPENIGEILLCQIPSVSHVTAVAIMKQFTSIAQLIDTIRQDPTCLDKIQCESKGKARKISKACVENIVKYLGGEPSVSGGSSFD